MGAKPHKRWIPKPVPVKPLDYDPEYVGEIMEYYHSNHLVPDLLPANYKAYLLAAGLAETLPGCPFEYVVFTEKGGALARASNKEGRLYNKSGRPKKSA